MLKMKKYVLWMLTFVCLSMYSCTNLSNERSFDKFVSRFNAKEYACAATYIYPGDRMQMAFFVNEIMENVPNSFMEIEERDAKGDYVVVKCKWHNADNFFKNYFVNIGKPLLEGDILIDTIRVRKTADGDFLSFNWGCPEINTNKLKLANISIMAENVERMNIRSRPSTDSKIIGKLKKGEDILIKENYNLKDNDTGWSQCYFVNSNSQVQTGYIYTANMTLKESAFFSLGMFDSVSIFVAVIVIVIICVPLFFIRAIIENLFDLGCGGTIAVVVLVLGLLYVLYQMVEKILFEVFIINLPY